MHHNSTMHRLSTERYLKIAYFYHIKCNFRAPECTKNQKRLGLRPRPRWGSLQRSPDPLAGFGWDRDFHNTRTSDRLATPLLSSFPNRMSKSFFDK